MSALKKIKVGRWDLGGSTGWGFSVVVVTCLYKKVAFQPIAEWRENPSCQDGGRGAELLSLSRSPQARASRVCSWKRKKVSAAEA